MKTFHILIDPNADDNRISDAGSSGTVKDVKKTASAAASSVSQLKITNVMSLNECSTGKPANVAATNARSRLPSTALPDRYALKPWLKPNGPKTLTAYARQLQPISLYALFKCMSPECSFSNDRDINMLAHLRQHNHQHAAVADEQRNGQSAGEKPWLECAYCTLLADTPESLVRHTNNVHKSSIFQCPFCFYRSCSAYNVIMHQAAIHAQHVTSVLVCLGKTKALSSELPLIHASRAQYVQPLRCDSGKSEVSTSESGRNVTFESFYHIIIPPECRQRFYTIDAFMNHLRAQHKNSIRCSLCSRTVSLATVKAHMQFEHNLGQYACLYCSFGANDHNVLRNHMWRQHPTKLLYVMCRLRLVDMLNVSVMMQFGVWSIEPLLSRVSKVWITDAKPLDDVINQKGDVTNCWENGSKSSYIVASLYF